MVDMTNGIERKRDERTLMTGVLLYLVFYGTIQVVNDIDTRLSSEANGDSTTGVVVLVIKGFMSRN